jgi:predicted acylesterase/phospholipase RssA
MDKFGTPIFFEPMNKKNKNLRTLVLSGGAIKCMYLIGALHGMKAFFSFDIFANFNTLVGNSSGAIVCFFLSLGFSPFEIFKKLSTNDNLISVNLNLLSPNQGQRHGRSIFTSQHIFEHVAVILKSRILDPNMSFFEHFSQTNKKLVVVAFNITTNAEESFSYSSHPEMPVIEALKFSSSIPILFESFSNNKNIYIDGMVSNNFPINVALREKVMNSEILAVTTLQSTYDFSVKNWFNHKDIHLVMINDTDDKISYLITTTKDNFSMFRKGEIQGRSIVCSGAHARPRRKSF